MMDERREDIEYIPTSSGANAPRGGEADNADAGVGAFDLPSDPSGGTLSIPAEEIVPEHLDELPDEEHVEAFVDGKHV